MSWSIRLLRIKGIDVKVHLTFVLILVWAAYRWSASTGEGLRGALFGVVATLLLFAAVTLHELGHSFQARKFGVVVRDITLMPMGGLARLDEIPRQPGQELRIALAGPLVNFAIAGALIVAGFLLHTSAVVTIPQLVESLGQANWRGMLSYLTMANLLLGIFNLIPAFPMDGGRALRALLAMRLDYSRATAIAARVGQGLALLLGLWGLLSGGWTLVLIAVFVWLGAGQESRQAATDDALSGVQVGQAMIRQPQALRVTDSLHRAIELTLSTAQADFPVVHVDGRVVGLLTQHDLLKGLEEDGAAAPVMEVMRRKFPQAAPSDPLADALRRMSAGRVRAMPVVEPDGRLVGLLTADDVNEAYRLLAAGSQPGLARLYRSRSTQRAEGAAVPVGAELPDLLCPPPPRVPGRTCE